MKQSKKQNKKHKKTRDTNDNKPNQKPNRPNDDNNKTKPNKQNKLKKRKKQKEQKKNNDKHRVKDASVIQGRKRRWKRSSDKPLNTRTEEMKDGWDMSCDLFATIVAVVGRHRPVLLLVPQCHRHLRQSDLEPLARARPRRLPQQLKRAQQQWQQQQQQQEVKQRQ